MISRHSERVARWAVAACRPADLLLGAESSAKSVPIDKSRVFQKKKNNSPPPKKKITTTKAILWCRSTIRTVSRMALLFLPIVSFMNRNFGRKSS